MCAAGVGALEASEAPRTAAGVGNGAEAPAGGVGTTGEALQRVPLAFLGMMVPLSSYKLQKVAEDTEIINVLKKAANSSGGTLSTPATLASSLLVC